MIFYCMGIPHFAYPFICQWTFGLLLCFLAIVNNAVINIGYTYLFKTLPSILLCIYSKVELIVVSNDNSL